MLAIALKVNLAGTPEGVAVASAAGITTITRVGSLDYQTALPWVTALNAQRRASGRTAARWHESSDLAERADRSTVTNSRDLNDQAL